MANDININVTASYGGFEEAMRRMADVTGSSLDAVKASFAGMSDTASAAMANAATAISQFGPNIQAQAAKVQDLRSALGEVNTSITETKGVMDEAGASTEINANILDRYNAETYAARTLQVELNQAIDVYKSMLNEVYAAQMAQNAVLEKDAALYAKLEEAIVGATGAGGDAIVVTREQVEARELEAGITEKDAAMYRQLEEAIIGATTASAGRTAVAGEAGAAAGAAGAKGAEGVAADEAVISAVDANTSARDANTSAIDSQNAAMERAQLEEEKDAAAASGVTEAQQRLAAATVANNIAQVERRAVEEAATSVVGRDAGLMNELATAQARAAATAAELAAAQQAVAAETEVASESAGLFRMRLIAGENGIRGFVTSGLTSMPLLIGVIVSGFAIRAVEALQKTELELGNLAAATGQTISQIGSLTEAFKAQGVEETKVESAMTMLARAMEAAAQGSKSMQREFAQLGIDTNAWHGTLPPLHDALVQISERLHANQNDTEALASASRILGRGQQELIGILRQGPEALEANIDKFKGLGDAEEKAYQSARALAAQEAQLSAQWREIELPILGLVADALAGLMIMYDWLKANVFEVVYALQLFANVAAAVGAGAIKLQQDIATLNFHQAAVDAEEVTHRISDSWALMVTNLKKNQKDASDAINNALQLRYNPPSMPPHGGESDPITPTAKGGGSAMSAWREQLAEKESEFQGSHLAMIKMEQDFWQALIDTGKAKGKDLIAVQREVIKARMAYNKESLNDMAAERDAAAKIERIQDQENEFFIKSEMAREKAHLEALGTKLKAEAQYNAEIEKLDEDAALKAITLQEDAIKEVAKLKMRGTLDDVAVVNKEVADLKAAEDRKLQIQIDYLNRQKALILEMGQTPASTLPGNSQAQQMAAMAEATPEQLSAIAKIFKQIEDLKAEHTRKMQQLDDLAANQAKKSAEQAEKAWESIFKPVQTAMDQMIVGVLRGTQTIQQVFQKMGQDIVLSLVKNLANMALKWAEHFLIVNVLEKSSWATRIVETLTGSAAKRAAESTANVASVVSSAGAAGAAGFASVMEALPFPVNVGVAPGVMAESIAAVMSNVGMASAAGGMEVPHDMIAQVHKNEMVLPANISGGLRNLISAGNTEAGHSSRAATAMGAPTVHQHVQVTVNGGGKDMTPADIESAVKRAMRMGRLSLAHV